MPLALGCLALVFPRLAIFLLWLSGSYLERAIESGFWLLCGFLFMPLTTLAFAYSMNSLGPPGEIPPLGWVLVIVAVLADLGVVGKGQRSARNHFGNNNSN